LREERDSKELWKSMEKTKDARVSNCATAQEACLARLHAALCLQDFHMQPANLDVAFVLAGRGEIVGQLHSQPRFGRAAEGLR